MNTIKQQSPEYTATVINTGNRDVPNGTIVKVSRLTPTMYHGTGIVNGQEMPITAIHISQLSIVGVSK